jgi:predicted NBD/HSP70 family sugar kinase
MPRAARTDTIRAHNRALVLEEIRLHGPVTRGDLRRRTGLTPAGVAGVVTRLIEEGFVHEVGRRVRGRGQPAVLLDLDPEAGFTLGLHLDRDLVSGTLVDLKGVARGTVRTTIATPTPDTAIDLLRETCRSLEAGCPPAQGRLLGVGLVTVGPLDPERGVVLGPPHFPGWRDVALGERMREALGLPVWIENNATAAALGEAWYGAGRGVRNLLYVYLGLGLGGGVLLNGRLHGGTGRNAGEVGHVPVRTEDGWTPLENVVSLRAFRAEFGDEADVLQAASPASIEEHAALQAWIAHAADELGAVLAGIDNVLDLDAIVVGGRFAPNLSAALVAALQRTVPRFQMAHRPHVARILQGTVREDVAALGAAALPLYDVFSREP